MCLSTIILSILMFVICIYTLFVPLFSRTAFTVNSIKYHEIATVTLLGLRASGDYCHFISLLGATLTNIFFYLTY